MSIMRTLTINGAKFNVTPVVPASSVTLLAGAWIGDGESYSQVVELPGVTAHTKVDLQPTAEQLAEFHYKVLAFVAENDGGMVTVYAIGDKPRGDHTIQTTLTEVEATGKIRGNTVGTTMPRPDINQTDPKSADYVRGREAIVRSVNGRTPDQNGNVTVEGGGTGGGSGNSDIIYVTIDWDNMKASMNCVEIQEAMQTGKMVAYNDGYSTGFAQMSETWTMNESNEEVLVSFYAYFVLTVPTEDINYNIKNLIFDTLKIDSTGSVTLGPEEQIVGVPHPGTYEEVGKVLSVKSAGHMEWVDPSTLPGGGGTDGKDGEDGVSATHEWDGTVLTITSASGTSSADLKGEKGDKGDPGKSVTITHIAESDGDGAINMVAFSDGKTLTIRNGSKGSTPVKGTDYWTDADKTAMVNDVLSAFPTWTGGSY